MTSKTKFICAHVVRRTLQMIDTLFDIVGIVCIGVICVIAALVSLNIGGKD